MKITPGILKRVFGHFPRHLKSTVPGTFTYDDYVCYFLAEKDRMTDTSVLYWFRCLDIDGDGFLGKADLEVCYAMKVRARVWWCACACAVPWRVARVQFRVRVRVQFRVRVRARAQ